MAVTCPVDLDTVRLQREIQSVYARVATDPGESFHFYRGPEYAVKLLAYDPAAVAALPHATTVLASAGFEQVELRERFECFLGTSKERTAKKYGVLGVNVLAVKSGPQRSASH